MHVELCHLRRNTSVCTPYCENIKITNILPILLWNLFHKVILVPLAIINLRYGNSCIVLAKQRFFLPNMAEHTVSFRPNHKTWNHSLRCKPCVVWNAEIKSLPGQLCVWCGQSSLLSNDFTIYYLFFKWMKSTGNFPRWPEMSTT